MKCKQVGVFFSLLPFFTLLYCSGKYLNLNSDICVYSDFINTPTHFISKRQHYCYIQKGKWDTPELRGMSLLYITEENKQTDEVQIPTPESVDIKH